MHIVNIHTENQLLALRGIGVRRRAKMTRSNAWMGSGTTYNSINTLQRHDLYHACIEHASILSNRFATRDGTLESRVTGTNICIHGSDPIRSIPFHHPSGFFGLSPTNQANTTAISQQ
mmetsp:Transcript_10431/g.30508  ORF Transcript_10431/g.30508 Transcript_10431/m.30508 type:complete len:118 (+) Transcript_10431:1929-2282(+)